MSISMHIQNFVKIYKTVQDIMTDKRTDERMDGMTDNPNPI